MLRIDSPATLAELPLPTLADIAQVREMKLRDIREIVRLSSNKKMPGRSFDLPVASCSVGSRLSEISGTPCGGVDGKGGCYAKHGPISWPAARALHERNLLALGHPLFVPMTARLISVESPDWFRWHAAGDVQSVEHLALIVAVAVMLPDTPMWIPTQERAIVARFERLYGPLKELAPNLQVRVSMPRLDTLPTPTMIDGPRVYSLVATGARELPDFVHICPSSHQSGTCGDCRACWSDELVVAYPAH